MILVTGGLGYIGGKIVYELSQAKEKVLIIDNLATGVQRAIADCKIVIGDLADQPFMQTLFNRYPIEAVIHLAASTVVPESMTNPAKYYLNNLTNTLLLAELSSRYGVKQFIFSSTAAVYGMPESSEPIKETDCCRPINPYGRSKLMAEQVLQDIAQVSGMQYAILRYFNVAGADPAKGIGPFNPQSTLLIRYAVQTALGQHSCLNIYGDDYATPDGTGVRDYIHVADIANAHRAVLNYLRAGGESQILNCGYGHGASVLEVVKAVEQVIGRPLPISIQPRRPGDPDSVVSNVDKMQQLLGWRPQHDNLTQMVADSYCWEQRLLKMS